MNFRAFNVSELLAKKNKALTFRMVIIMLIFNYINQFGENTPIYLTL